MVGQATAARRVAGEVGSHCGKHKRACRFTRICPGDGILTCISRGTSASPPGSRASYVRLVHEGILGVFRLWVTGEETLASLWLPGHILGIMATVSDLEPRPRPGLIIYDVRALAPVTICRLHPDAFLSHVCREPSRAALVMQMLARQSMENLRLVARPARKGPEKALAHVLAALAESVGTVAPNGTLLPFCFSHQVLADMAGMTRSTASRAAQYLRRRGLVRIERKRVLVPSVVKLWDIVEEEFP